MQIFPWKLVKLKNTNKIDHSTNTSSGQKLLNREQTLLKDVSNILTNHRSQMLSPINQFDDSSHIKPFQPKKLFSSVDIKNVKLKSKSDIDDTNSSKGVKSSKDNSLKRVENQPKTLQAQLEEAMKRRYAQIRSSPNSRRSSISNDSPSSWL